MDLAPPAILITLKWMATPGQLIKVVALATGIPESTVFQHDRNLVVAGLRTKGGRGTSAAKVTARDAAHLLTAVMGSEQVKDSVETVQRYADTVEYFASSFRPKERGPAYEALRVPTLNTLPKEHSFIDALEAFISMAMDDSFDRAIGAGDASCHIQVRWPYTVAHIEVGDWRYRGRNRRTALAIYQAHTGPAERPGLMERYAKIDSRIIRQIGALLADRLEGVEDVAEEAD